MNKYFLHDGKEQKGPFSIDDLKEKGIKGDTPIWYEGLADWTTANKIEELIPILTVTPPEFKQAQSATPPPIKKPVKEVVAQPKKKRSTGWIIAVVVIALIVIGALTMISNNPNAIPGVKLQVNTPKPIVITTRADSHKSGLFKLRATVFATVQNQGGAGNVLVTFHVLQNGNDYDRTKSIYLGANQSTDVDVTFDEVKLADGKITYRVDASAQ